MSTPIWQENTETGIAGALAYAACDTAAPVTRPNTGTSMDWADNASGGAAFGWTLFNVKFTTDDYAWTDNEGEPVIVDPPISETQVAKIHHKAMVPTACTFTTYEVFSKIYALVTNATDSSGVITFTAAHSTRRAIIIELLGLGMYYMPSCEIFAGTPPAGLKTLATQPVTIDIFEGATVTAGFQPIQYQDA